MTDGAGEDRLSRPPVKISVLEEKVFAVFDSIQKNRDWQVARAISAFEAVNKVDHHLTELNRLHEKFRMAVLPDGGLKWKVMDGRARMGKEMVQLSALCQELYDGLVALCDRTCRRAGFLRARPIAAEQHRRLTSEQYRKQFYRDIWVPDAHSLPRYLEDDEWFKGLAEGLSQALLSLSASAFVLKEAYKDEFDIIFHSAAGRIEEFHRVGVAIPHDFLSYADPARVDRQRKIFEAVSLPASEAILARYLEESKAFSDFSAKIMSIRSDLEAMLQRMVMYRELIDIQLRFPHSELDSYIGYLSALDRPDSETSYLLRHISELKHQLEAQKNYYISKLWRMGPPELERTRAAVAAEREGFRKEETAHKARIAETVRELKAHRRDSIEELKSLDHFDRENDLNILKLPSEIDIRAGDEELAGALSAFRRCVQIRMEEFSALCSRIREEVFRSRSAIEGSSLPEPARRSLLDAVRDFCDLQAAPAGRHFLDQYPAAVEHYKALSAARRALGELCLQLVGTDLSARCRDFEKQDQRFAGHLAAVTRKAGLPAAYGGEGLEDLVWKYGVAHEILYKEAEEYLASCKRALLEAEKERIARAERTIMMDEMLRKLELIAALCPRRPVSLAEETAQLERYRLELFSTDLVADAQQYWMKVREQCESLAASVRVNLDASMVAGDDRKAAPEALLDRLDSRFWSLAAALDARLREIDANLAQVPELNDLKLSEKPCPDLRSCAGNERALPGRRLQHLESAYKSIHSARERASRELSGLHRTAVELHLGDEFASRLKELSSSNLDAAVVGLASLRMAVRAHLFTEMHATLAGLEIPVSGRWELPAGAPMRSWLEAWAEFLELVTASAHATIEEAADLRDKLASSDEANRLRRKCIGKFPLRDVLRASDTASMRDLSYLLFEAEGEMETVRRDMELALKRYDLPALVGGVRRWKLLRKRLGEMAAARYAPGEAPLIEIMRDFEDRRLREYALSTNKAAFPDQAFIEDIERAVMRCRLRDKKMSAREFHKVLTALQKDGRFKWKDFSDRFLMTPGEHPEYRLTVEPSGPGGESTRGTVLWGDRTVEFVYDPKRMLLSLKEK
jgi:hypothetical protein